VSGIIARNVVLLAAIFAPYGLHFCAVAVYACLAIVIVVDIPIVNIVDIPDIPVAKGFD
jgi:hypothetical protein